MKGIGTDIVDVERIKKSHKRWGEKFLKRLFTENELSYCSGKYPQLAGRFAAKEAVMKALGVGFPSILFSDIEIVSDGNSPPSVNLLNRAKKIQEEKDISSVFISLSHIDDKACGFAIAV
ncbi:TPA: holo-[acyl-carrier-protein] synthase [bacterium]|nr:holo-[acyl-carrier-protein] synthase [bacterium]